MRHSRLVFCGLAVVAITGTSFLAMADAFNFNFDAGMTNTWNNSVIWTLALNYVPPVLPPTFTLDPTVADVNGGINIAQTPITIYPNGILDSDELALLGAILANPTWNRTSTGGASHTMIHNAWTNNFNVMWRDLGGNDGDADGDPLLPPNSMIPDIEYLFTALLTIGDPESLSIPLLVFDLATTNTLVSQLIGEQNLRVPNLANYQLMYTYLSWCGDADGDGCSNLSEYLYFKPMGGRAQYIAAAMDPAIKPPGCSGELRCDGTGGLFGEYFDEMTMSSLKVTRVDPRVDFDWHTGSPDPALGVDTFSVRWTGWVTPKYSEVYTFCTVTDDGARLWLDNQPLVNKWINQGAAEWCGTTSMPLVAGQPYYIKFEYYEGGGDASASLWWSSSSQTKHKIDAMYLTPGGGEGDIGADWIRNPANGHYYKVTPPGLTWDEARAEALRYGAYLATMNDVDENSWAAGIFTVFGSFFLGLNDVATEGTFVWMNGDPVTYTNWSTGEPNNFGGLEDYGHMYTNGLWNDIDLTYRTRGLMESDAGQMNYDGPLPQFKWGELGEASSFYVKVRRPFGTATYQWRHDGSPIPGATTSVLSFPSLAMSDAGNYSCALTDQSPANVVTPSVPLSMYPVGGVPVAGLAGIALAGIACAAAGIRVLARRRKGQ